jgi:hypothetical protein
MCQCSSAGISFALNWSTSRLISRADQCAIGLREARTWLKSCEIRPTVLCHKLSHDGAAAVTVATCSSRLFWSSEEQRSLPVFSHTMCLLDLRPPGMLPHSSMYQQMIEFMTHNQFPFNVDDTKRILTLHRVNWTKPLMWSVELLHAGLVVISQPQIYFRKVWTYDKFISSSAVPSKIKRIGIGRTVS